MPSIVKRFEKQHELDLNSEKFSHNERREKVGDENSVFLL